MGLVSLFAVVFSFVHIAVGDSTNGVFIWPTAPGPNENYVADLSWTLGSTQEIQWTTTIDSYYINVWQQAVGQRYGKPLQTIYRADSGGAGQQSLTWQVQTYNSDLNFSSVYFLWLNPESPQGFTSHYFNITQRAQSSSSSSSSTAFTSSTSLKTSTTATSTSSTPPNKSSAPASTSPASTSSASTSSAPTSPATASPASDSSSTVTVRVGFGVGLGIGLPLVLIAGIWIGLKSVKQRQSSSRGTSSDVPLSQFPNNKYPPNESIYYQNQFHEAPGRSYEPHEAPGERDLIELGS